MAQPMYAGTETGIIILGQSGEALGNKMAEL